MAALISPPELQYTVENLLLGKRSDGRTLLQFRDIHIATGVLAQTFGSARVSCAGTDVIAGIKLETGAVDSDERLQVTVELSQSSFQSLPSDPTLSLTSHAYDLVASLSSHPQFSIIPGSKCWHMQLHIDFLSVGGGGNLHDIMSIAIRSALYDLKIPRTRPVAYMQSGAAQGKAADDEDEGEDVGMKALLKGRKNAKTQQDKQATAADFELLDYEADTGEHLRDRDSLPVAVSLYLTPQTQQPFLDATLFESFASPTRLICTFTGNSEGELRGLRQEIPDGYASSEPNEIPFSEIDQTIDAAAGIASNLTKALNERLKDPKTRQSGVRLGSFP